MASFIQTASDHTPDDKIPSAFIITGPSIASQELLFEQLSETLQIRTRTKTVRLRSGDATNLKAVLRKIIHDVTSPAAEEGEDLDLAVGKDVRPTTLRCRRKQFSNVVSRSGNILATTLKRSIPTLSQTLRDILPLHFKIVKLLIAVYFQT